MRRARWVVVAALALALAACGTRLPDRSFARAATESVTRLVGPATAGSGPAVPGGPAVGGGPATTVVAGGAGGAGTAAGSAGASAPLPAAKGNTASDVGVTATTITLGTISSRSNAFDPTAFVGPQYGAEAFVDDLNRHGGIHGRTVRLIACDDHGDPTRNQQCVQQLIGGNHVFALVSNAIFSYDGASYVQSHGVPDIGSQPIDTAYDQYSHLWDLYGESYPRNGTVGYGGKLEGGTEVYRYFKTAFPKVPLKAGVVYYNQSASQRYGDNLVRGLQAEGYAVVSEQINFALPDYDSAVLDMRSQGVRYVYDSLDSGGNQNLCSAMDANGLSDQVTAKVTTTQSWVGSITQDYQNAPKCRNKIWATGNTRNYEDTRYPQVQAFREAMARQGTDGPDQLSEWALEGWAGAQWAADAIASCGAAVTRRCVEAYVGSGTSYDGHGLLTPRSFQKYPHRPHGVDCLNVARWQDHGPGGGPGWVTEVPDMDTTCYDVPYILYSP